MGVKKKQKVYSSFKKSIESKIPQKESKKNIYKRKKFYKKKLNELKHLSN